MSASHLHDRLDAYVDGELAAAERQAADQHLAGCAECRGELAARREFDRRVAAQAVADPGERYWAEFAARVEARLPPPAEVPRAYDKLTGWLFPHGRFAWPRAAGALVACTLAVYVGVRGFNPERAVLRPAGEISRRPRPPAAPVQRAAPVPVAPAPQIAPPAPSAGSPPAIGAPRPPGSRPNGVTNSSSGAVPKRSAKSPASAAPNPLEKTVAGSAPSRTDGKTQAPGPAPTAPQAMTSGDDQPAPSGGGANPRGFAAAPRDEKLAAKTSPAPPPADAVERFVAAAVAGDRTAAGGIAGSAVVAPVERAEMQRWLDLAAAPVTTSAPPTATPSPRPLAFGKPKAAASGTLEQALRDAPSPREPGPDAWLALDDLAWPRRDRPAMRSSLAAIASGLLAHPADARARERARVVLEWLAVTSPTADETARWRARLATLPPE